VSTIVLDGLYEEDFRRSIENRLREGSAGAAIARLRALLAPYAGPEGMLPHRFLTVEAADLVLSGWDALHDAVRRHDKPGRPVTAISIAFGWPGDEALAPDAEGRLKPHLETSYYTDNAYPFSQSGRDDLLEGYSFYGCTWSGDCEATDNALSLHGIDDLHGALAMLEERLLDSDEPDDEGVQAGSLGACLLSVLLVQAVSEQIARDVLPRPLCVMAGSNGVYPYFDAPVAGMPDEVRKADEADEDVVEGNYEIPAPRYSSLLMTGIPRAKKRAVLVLEESENELANRLARLRGLNHAEDGNGEIQHEETPFASAPEQPDPVVAVASDTPLLAKKPDKPTRDLYDMLGLRQLDPNADEKWPRDQSFQAEPVRPPTRSDTSAVPGFSLLDTDQQERSHWFVWPGEMPMGEVAWSEPAIPADQPRHDWQGAPDLMEESCATPPTLEAPPADAITQPSTAGIGARLWIKIKARLGF
jgi:hypothetical protein